MSQREIDLVREAVTAAASNVPGREKDKSFLERVLRDALRDELDGATTEHKLDMDGWRKSLGGVDVVFRDRSGHVVGIETKVWDVEDSLYDLFKLAAAVQQEQLSSGYVAVAALSRQWQKPGIIAAMSSIHPAASGTVWETDQVIEAQGTLWSTVYARTAVKPRFLPQQFVTTATAPIAMPYASDHEIRIIGIRPIGKRRVQIGEDGATIGSADEAGDEEAGNHDGDDALFQKSLRAGSPAMRIAYSSATPEEKLMLLADLLEARPDLETEIAGYSESALMQRDASAHGIDGQPDS